MGERDSRAAARVTVRKVRASQGKGAGQLPVKATAHPQIGDEARCKPHPMQERSVKCGPQAPVRWNRAATYGQDRSSSKTELGLQTMLAGPAERRGFLPPFFLRAQPANHLDVALVISGDGIKGIALPALSSLGTGQKSDNFSDFCPVPKYDIKRKQLRQYRQSKNRLLKAVLRWL